MTCSNCGTDAPAGARFCASCGAALTTRADERRVVTVLFADLVGFTTLSETMDPERVKNLVDRCFQRLAADVSAFGGVVDKFVGDGLLALFGAPIAHEDDPERAVRAALRMQQTLAAVAVELGVPVRMRIGINTGEVLVGALSAGGDYTAMGDVVNTASRLQTAASPGQIVVGPHTHSATHAVVDYTSLGALQVKGREEAVAAWVATRTVAPPGHRLRRRAPLVGREGEMALLQAGVLAATRRRRAHVLLLVGEPGVGKSRLADELMAFARKDEGALVLQGRCVPYGEANPWWPLAEAVRQACGIDASDPGDVAIEKCRTAIVRIFEEGKLGDCDEAEALRVADGLLHLMDMADCLVHVDAARARDEVVRSVQMSLEALVRQHPVVLTLSELHWADDLVLSLLDSLLDRLHDLPLVLLATARPELSERWAPRPGHHDVVSVRVGPLDDAASDELLVSMLESDVPADLRAVLRERSGGNPLFLEELAALIRPGGTQPSGEELPATLRGIVAARLDALDRDERGMIDDAAVVGRRGPVAMLFALAEARGGGVTEAVTGGLLTMEGDEFAFMSEVVREVAYGTLTKAERARRHARIGDWLARRAETLGREAEDIDQIAHHLAAAAELAGDLGAIEGVDPDVTARASDAVERAIARAEAREWWVEVTRLATRALSLPDSNSRRRGLLVSRARGLAEHRDLEGARVDIDEAIASAQTAGDDACLAEALTVRGMVEQRASELDAAIATLDRAIALARECGERHTEADALRARGMAQMFRNDFDDANASITGALEVYRKLGDGRGEAWALQNLAWTAFSQGDTAGAETWLHESAAKFTEVHDRIGRDWATGLLAWVRYFQGRLHEAEELARGVLAHDDQNADPWATGMTHVLLASIALWSGRATVAVDDARQALRDLNKIDDLYGRTQATVPLARALTAIGQYDEAASLLARLYENCGADAAWVPALLDANLSTDLGDGRAAEHALVSAGVEWLRSGGAGENLAIMGMARLQQSDAAGALEALDEALTLSSSDNRHPVAVRALARVAAGDSSGALADASTALADGGGTHRDRVLALSAIACVRARAGDADGAAAASGEARAVAGGTDDRVAQTQAALGRACALNAVGRPEAAAALAEAREVAASIGMRGPGWETAFSLAAGVSLVAG